MTHSSHRPHPLDRARRLGGRAVLVAALSGCFTGVTAASADPGGNGNHNGWSNPNNPHYSQAAASAPAPAGPSLPAPTPAAPVTPDATPAAPGHGKHLGWYKQASAPAPGNGNGRAVGRARHVSAVTRVTATQAVTSAPAAATSTVHAVVAAVPPSAAPMVTAAVTRASSATRTVHQAAPPTSLLTVLRARAARAREARVRAHAHARARARTRRASATTRTADRAAAAAALARTGNTLVTEFHRTGAATRTPARTTPGTVTTAGHAAPAPGALSVVNFENAIGRYIPVWIQLALASAISLAVAFAVIAVRNGRRAQRQGREIAEASAAAAAASAAAIHDPLTGLLNRRGFEDALTRELARSRRHGRQFVIAYADVRGLKTVNDNLGHAAGDTLLKNVAALLTGCARAGDTVARLGGDEFALLLAEHSAADGIAMTTRIADAIATTRTHLALPHPWDLTVGAAAYPADGQDAATLLDIADRRLYEQRGIALAATR